MKRRKMDIEEFRDSVWSAVFEDDGTDNPKILADAIKKYTDICKAAGISIDIENFGDVNASDIWYLNEGDDAVNDWKELIEAMMRMGRSGKRLARKQLAEIAQYNIAVAREISRDVGLSIPRRSV